MFWKRAGSFFRTRRLPCVKTPVCGPLTWADEKRSNLPRHRGPGAFPRTALEGGFNEGDALPTALNISVFASFAHKFPARLPFAHVNFKTPMQPRESVVKPLAVPGWKRVLSHEIGGHVF